MPRCGCSDVLVSGCACGVEDSDTITWIGVGDGEDPYAPEVIVDPDPQNNLEANANGLYVEGPRGIMSAATPVVANQGSIAPDADLTGLNATVTIPAEDRWIKITLQIGSIQSNAGPEYWALRIQEGANIIAGNYVYIAAANERQAGCTLIGWIEAPSAGVHTYKARMVRATGSGTGQMNADSAEPATFVVEDAGPA